MWLAREGRGGLGFDGYARGFGDGFEGLRWTSLRGEGADGLCELEVLEGDVWSR